MTMVWKFRVEWKQLYSWLEYKDGKMFYLWCSDSDNMQLSNSLSRGAQTLRLVHFDRMIDPLLITM